MKNDKPILFFVHWYLYCQEDESTNRKIKALNLEIQLERSPNAFNCSLLRTHVKIAQARPD